MSEVMTEGRAWDYKGGVVVKTTRPAVPHLSDDVTVIWRDKRQISPEQRRKAYALLGEISIWSGMSTDDVKLTVKHDFLQRHIERLHQELFSLSDCDVTTARDFITYLIDFMLEFDVPSRRPLYELNDDVERYVYACMMQRKCAVCGQKADIHHCEGSTVGMGRNRKTMVHLGLELMPLCREHHTECHNIGQTTFNSKYHLIGITADEKICKKVGLKYAD